MKIWFAERNNVRVSIEEYVRTSYRPDCDYVDGEVLERNWGEHDHSDLQTELVYYFRARRKQWRLHAVVEQRVQVSPNVWVINPASRRVFTHSANGIREVKDAVLRTENPAIELSLGEIFAGLDDARA
jgi:Uma2 family endonuclease